MAQFDTLEAAQAEIVRLNDQVAELTNERDTLSQNNTNLTGELESVRKLNQQYFNKLSQQFVNQDDHDQGDSDQEESLEDYAKTLDIIK